MLDEVKGMVRELSAEDWNTFLTWAIAKERPRRESAPFVAAEVAEVVAEAWGANPELKPDFAEAAVDESSGGYPLWVRPTSRLSAYPPAARVSYNGRDWENVLPRMNVGVPDEARSGWRELVETEAVATDAGRAAEEQAQGVATGVEAPMEQEESGAESEEQDEPAANPPAAGPRPGAAASF